MIVALTKIYTNPKSSSLIINKLWRKLTGCGAPTFSPQSYCVFLATRSNAMWLITSLTSDGY